MYKFIIPSTQRLTLRQLIKSSTSNTNLIIPKYQFSTTLQRLDQQVDKPVDVSLKELLGLIKNKQNAKKEFYLVDVREKEERTLGAIPTSIWIPLGEIESALKLDKEDFKAKYRFPKFKDEDNIIFHCRSGVRSSKAQDIALKLGYKNSRNYKGSWNEFSKENPELIWIDQNLK